MGNCKNCKFWEKEELFYENFGYCNCKKFAYEEEVKKEEEDNYHVLYSDSEGYMATLVVNKDFGCIDFEER